MSAERRSRYLRVVRPGSGAGSDAAATPPLPVEPPLTPPLWLDPPLDRPLDAPPGPQAAAPGRRHGDTAIPAQSGRAGTADDAGTAPGTGHPDDTVADLGFLGSGSFRPGASGSGAFGSVAFGSGSRGSARAGSGLPGSGFPGSGLPGSGFPGAGLSDEDPVGAALRARLHQAVGEVRPASDSLARLRRAVPQRRTLRRRAYGGAAVAASLALLGLTALHSLGPDTSTSAETGPAGQLMPGAHVSASGQGRVTSDTSTPGTPWSGGSAFPSRSGRPGAVLVPLPSGGVTTVAASVPHSPPPSGAMAECNRGQLGNGAAGIAPADASGVVYGSFAVSNVSRKPCRISSPGAIAVLSPVGTNATRFTVTPHTATDPAVSLPAPDPTHPAIALAPGQSYVVDFAFVPSVCPSNSSAGPTGTASAAPATPGAASAGTTGSTGSTAGTAADSTAGGAAGSPSSTPGTPGGTGSSGSAGGTGNPSSPGSPSVQLATVPASGGAAAASTTLQGACAGTIYRTDPLAAPH